MNVRLLCFFVSIGLLGFCAAVAQNKSEDPGMMMFNNACRTCHTIREGDNRLGPNHYGIVGRKSGTVMRAIGGCTPIKPRFVNLVTDGLTIA